LLLRFLQGYDPDFCNPQRNHNQSAAKGGFRVELTSPDRLPPLAGFEVIIVPAFALITEGCSYEERVMKISHVHCGVRDLQSATKWLTSRCQAVPTFTDERMAVFPFGEFTLILDAAPHDSIATIGFNSVDCDSDFATLVARGVLPVEEPRNRPYGARVAYLRGPGALTLEIEQLLPTQS